MKSFDWFGLAPYGAGSPPAFVLAINLYNSVMTVVDNGLSWIAVIVAGAGIIGMMAVEIGTYKMLARAFADKEWKAAGLAFVGACIVTGLIIFSVYLGADTRALFSSTAVMQVGYLAIMVREYLERKKTNVLTDGQNRIAELEAERLLQNSRNRGAKLSSASAGQAILSTGQTGQNGAYNFDPAKLAAVVAYLRQSSDPQAVTVRELAGAGLGIGKSAAAIYKNEAMKQVKP